MLRSRNLKAKDVEVPVNSKEENSSAAKLYTFICAHCGGGWGMGGGRSWKTSSRKHNM